ncbi:PAS domain S-box protein [Candidatus Bathyarchaeota archaeon]|nr:PAS domain S-box protein [Candidatus Bathyarchaeota archaeon]
MSQLDFTVKFWLPHSKNLDTLYKVLDPFFLFLLSSIYVAYKLALVNAPSDLPPVRRLIRGVVLSVTWISIAFITLFVAEVFIVKPLFRISRPYFWVENSIVRDIMVGNIENTEPLRGLSEFDFNSNIGKAVIHMNAVNVTRQSVRQSDLVNYLVTRGYSESTARKEIAPAASGIGLPRQSTPLEYRIKLLKEIEGWRKQEIRPWLIGLISSKMRDEKDKRDSCPSGHVMRQTVVLFFAFLLLVQRREVRKKVFGSNYRQLFFVITITVIFFIVALSRIYGYEHTLSDELLSLGLPVFILPFFLLIQYKNLSTTAQLEKQRYDSLVNRVEELLYETNYEDEITFMNPAFAKTFGYMSVEDLIANEGTLENGRNVVRITNFYVRPKHREILKDELELRKGKVLDFIVYVKSKNKRPFYLSVDSNWIGQDGKDGIRGAGREVTWNLRLYNGFYQTNRLGILTFCDETFARAFKYDASDLIGLNFQETLYLNPGKREISLKRLSERIIDFEWIAARTSNNQIIVVQVKNQLIRQDRRIYGAEGTIQSIQIKGVYVIQDDKIVYADDEFARLFGYSQQEIRTRRYLDLVAPESLSLVKKEVERKLFQGYKRSYEFTGVCKDGKTVRVIADSEGSYYKGKPAVIGYVIESTIDKELKEGLKRRERFSAIGEAANDMTHWFGNIMGPILGAATRIDNEINHLEEPKATVTRVLEDLSIIITNVKRAIKMKMDLMEAIRPSDFVQMEPRTTISFEGLISEAIASLTVPQNVRIKVDVDPTVSCIPNKSSQLYKVFTYLIKNAFEAMPNGGDLTIIGSYRPMTNIFELSFIDTGIGIKEEQKSHVFKPFWSTKPSTSESGTGLGLWYCINALDDMNADIDFESQEGKGTTFKITFFDFK